MAKLQASCEGEVGTGRVAGDCDAFGIDAEFLRAVLDDPAYRRDTIVEWNRKRMLGREPVVDAHKTQSGTLRKLARGAVIDIEVARHPAATVHEHDRRRRSPRARIVEPYADRAARGDDDPFLDVRDPRRTGAQIELHQLHDLACLGRCQLVDRLDPQRRRPNR